MYEESYSFIKGNLLQLDNSQNFQELNKKWQIIVFLLEIQETF